MSERILITGLGAITSFGLTTSDFWTAISNGRSAIKSLTPAYDDLKISIGATVPDFNPASYFTHNEIPLLDRCSMYAVLAAQQAVTDANFSDSNQAITKAAVVIGSGCGGKHTDEEGYLQLYKNQRSRVHPLAILKGMHSASSTMVSHHLGIKGPVFTVASACASGAHAISQGAMLIQTGNADVAVVGGSDAPFTFGLLKAWDALRIVSNDACRPFCNSRNGLVLGEGAGVIVLESESHAKKRDAHIYAELAGFGMSSDAGHITRPDVNGMSQAMVNALKHARISAEDVDYINAHGTGTQVNDAAETEAIHMAFGSHANRLAISSTKSMHGHALGASSALEIIATVLTLKHNIIPPTINYLERDEKCDLDYVPNQAREQKIDIALSNSFAFGGLNAVIALRAY